MKDKKGQILIVVLLLVASFLPMKGNTKTKPLQEHKNNLSVSSYPSPQTIKGIVQDQKGEPLIGVSVIAKGTTQGSASYYPCKSYGQSRFTPVYYYGDFDPNDLRRDVTCTVTGSSGTGAESLLNFNKGSRLNGGIALNKWDENRMNHPWTTKQAQSSINDPYMRFSEIILMQAEVKAALGEDAEARSLLDQIRNRAFGSAGLARSI